MSVQQKQKIKHHSAKHQWLLVEKSEDNSTLTIANQDGAVEFVAGTTPLTPIVPSSEDTIGTLRGMNNSKNGSNYIAFTAQSVSINGFSQTNVSPFEINMNDGGYGVDYVEGQVEFVFNTGETLIIGKTVVSLTDNTGSTLTLMSNGVWNTSDIFDGKGTYHTDGNSHILRNGNLDKIITEVNGSIDTSVESVDITIQEGIKYAKGDNN